MNDPILMSMDVIKDALVDVAIQVLMSLEDGKIDFGEGMNIAFAGMASSQRILTALKRLEKEDLETLIMKLRNSDLQ
jgi:hypothetical protein